MLALVTVMCFDAGMRLPPLVVCAHDRGELQWGLPGQDPDFGENAAAVWGFYVTPPDNAVVWSVDEKSQIQAKSRPNRTKPAMPGAPVRRDANYVRHGTRVLFAALDVHEGDV